MQKTTANLTLFYSAAKSDKSAAASLAYNFSEKGILLSIASAFLIVLLFAFGLRMLSTAIENRIAKSEAQLALEKKVGWQPGQYIEAEMGNKYFIY
ncbi:hypothetical protein C4569_03975 [Candidatus Parcubacteria bacterium]|nr:MAG: hypothetical protein C4569_03975 [Candidatus Parcubacteria bacterium]